MARTRSGRNNPEGRVRDLDEEARARARETARAAKAAPAAQAASGIDPDAGTKTDTEPVDSNAGTKTDTEPVDSNAGTKTDTEPVDSNAGTKTDTEPVDPNAGTKTDTEPVDSNAGTKTDTEPVDPNAGTQTDDLTLEGLLGINTFSQVAPRRDLLSFEAPGEVVADRQDGPDSGAAGSDQGSEIYVVDDEGGSDFELTELDSDGGGEIDVSSLSGNNTDRADIGPAVLSFNPGRYGGPSLPGGGLASSYHSSLAEQGSDFDLSLLDSHDEEGGELNEAQDPYGVVNTLARPSDAGINLGRAQGLDVDQTQAAEEVASPGSDQADSCDDLDLLAEQLGVGGGTRSGGEGIVSESSGLGDESDATLILDGCSSDDVVATEEIEGSSADDVIHPGPRAGGSIELGVPRDDEQRGQLLYPTNPVYGGSRTQGESLPAVEPRNEWTIFKWLHTLQVGPWKLKFTLGLDLEMDPRNWAKKISK